MLNLTSPFALFLDEGLYVLRFLYSHCRVCMDVLFLSSLARMTELKMFPKHFAWCIRICFWLMTVSSCFESILQDSLRLPSCQRYYNLCIRLLFDSLITYIYGRFPNLLTSGASFAKNPKNKMSNLVLWLIQFLVSIYFHYILLSVESASILCFMIVLTVDLAIERIDLSFMRLRPYIVSFIKYLIELHLSGLGILI